MKALVAGTLLCTLATWSHGSDLVQPAVPDLTASDEARRDLRLRTTKYIVAGTLGVAAYGATHWWEDGFTRDFRTENEGWFGRNTYAGGADKLGHGYTNYVGTRLLTWAFEGLGHAHQDALHLSVLTSLATFTAVEVLDGFSRRWRFSREDALMNVAGAGLAWASEKYPDFDRLVDFRLLYRRSSYGGERHTWDPLGDQSGQTYLLILKGDGLSALRENDLGRYLELALGYNARGFEQINGLSDTRSRHAYIGLSLNLSRLLDDTVFRDHPGRMQKTAHGVLEFVQVPGTAALDDHTF